MRFLKKFKSITALLFAGTFAFNANADLVGYVDVVLDYKDADGGQIYYGRGDNIPNYGVLSEEQALDYLTRDDVSTRYVSLSLGAYVVLGFTNENVVDGEGNDIYIGEIGSGSEAAEIYVSSNGFDFTFLGIANNANGVAAFDLASISFIDVVRAVKIVGLDNAGSAPGFDLQYVKALNRVDLAEGETNSFGDAGTSSSSDVSSPSALLGLMLMGAGFAYTRKKK